MWLLQNVGNVTVKWNSYTYILRNGTDQLVVFPQDSHTFMYIRTLVLDF